MHFTVGIITEKLGEYFNALEPYDENPAAEYLEFHNSEEDLLRHYKTGSEERVKMKDGRLLNKWDNEFKVVTPSNIPFSEYDYDSRNLKKGEIVTNLIPKNLEIVEVPYTDIYDSFEEYMKEEHMVYQRDEVTGLYGDWYNSNGKYDWFQLGGRWRGMLLVKDSVSEYEIGESGVFGDNLESRDVPKGYRWVDSARIKDIEWEKMKELRKEKAIISWEEIMEKLNSGISEADKKQIKFINGIKKEDTKEDFINRRTEFATYSILTEEDGWIDWDEIDESKKEYSDYYFKRFIKKANQEHFFSVVDCHV